MTCYFPQARATALRVAACLLALVTASCDKEKTPLQHDRKSTVSSDHGLSAPAELRVLNGAFSDLSGLKPLGHSGWHHGVPAAWESSAKDTNYSVRTEGTGTPPYCNQIGRAHV
jgi:hypothetical protein